MEFEIRENRKPHGRKKLARERSAYFYLVQQGYSSIEACRIVGVDPRTGRRWRNGYTVPDRRVRRRAIAPVVVVDPVSPSSRYLRQEERVYIADRLRERASIRSIATELGRSPSTISREICRNRHPGSGVYRPHAAQTRAEARRPRPKIGKIAANPELCAFIQDLLTRRWSPEQICQSLRRWFPHRPEMHVVHETIYQALYVQGRGELRRELTRALRTGRAARKPRAQADRRRSHPVQDMLRISERPAEVEDRAVPGHWEGDLIIGKDGRSAIGTLVERTTRYLLLVHLPERHTAEATRDALVETIVTLPTHLKRSLTWDQGSEMAAHREFSIAAGIPVYFCDPGSPWQRGSNENTNGLLRQYFPKGTDLSTHDREHLQAVAAELNSRPRKTLDWQTPAERLATLINTTN